MSVFDREKARNVLEAMHQPQAINEGLLDALEACVRPGLAQTIDRDALKALLQQFAEEAIQASELGMWPSVANQADDVLALLRPAEGVTLTRDEAAKIIYALDIGSGGIHYSIYKKLTAE